MMGAIESTQFLNPWDNRVRAAHDLVDDEEAIPLATLLSFERDLQNEPLWRADADIACEYYDGNQLSMDRMQTLKDLDMDAVVRNISAATINSVLGLEEKSRTDWRVVTDYDNQQDVASAVSVKMGEAERESHADLAMSEAYAQQIKAGFGCVEVSRETNPFKSPYRVRSIHRREIRWDPRSRALDWSDARFVRRDQWFDADVLCAHFPQQADVIQFASGYLGQRLLDGALNGEHVSVHLERAFNSQRSWAIEDLEWRDTMRKRVRLSELWYRTYIRGDIFRLPSGQAIEFDEYNPMHMALVESGKVKLQQAVYDKLRMAYLVGPHRIMDIDTGRRDFPYVPFWGYREDLTGSPYGMMRAMIPIQDEINLRLQKMMYLLKSRRTIVHANVVDGKASDWNDMKALAREVGNQSAFIVINENAKPGSIQVDENLALAEAQHRAMADAISAMPSVSGVYQTMLGQSTSTTAASAISQLVEQGATTLAAITGNYTFARRRTGEMLCDLVKQDMAGKEMEVMIDTGIKRKTVKVNTPSVDEETGMQTILNNVSTSQIKVQLTDVPSSPGHRAQQFNKMTEMMKFMPPQIQSFILPFLIEESDMDKRKEVAKLIREKMGVHVDSESPEAQAAAKAQADAAEQQSRQMVAQFEANLKEQAARAEKLGAEAEKIRAEAKAAGADQSMITAADQRIAEIESNFKEEFLKMQNELMIAKAEQSMAKLKIHADVEAKEAESLQETERAKIRADADKEIARIEADAAKASNDHQRKLSQLSNEVDGQMSSVSSDLAKQLDAVRQSLKESEIRTQERQKNEKEEPDTTGPAIEKLAGSIEQMAKSMADSSKALTEELEEVKAAVSAPRESKINLKKTGDGSFEATKVETIKVK